MIAGMETTDTAALAEQLAEAIRDHPSVLRLAGGDFGMITTPLPGRRVTGVRVPDSDEPIEIAVVLRLDRPLADTAADLRARAVAVAGQRQVDITVADVATGEAEGTGAGPEAGSDVHTGDGGQ